MDTTTSTTTPIPATIPAPPQNLYASGDYNCLDVSWDASVGADSYSIYLASQSGAENSAIRGIKLTNTRIENLLAGCQYYLEVTAVNKAGESTRSQEATGVPLAPTTTPIPQTGPQLVKSGELPITSIEEGQTISFLFDGQTGESVQFSTPAGQDYFIQIYDPRGHFVTASINSIDFTPRFPGTYTLAVFLKV